MNIDHLRYFLVLSQEMHYSRAAQRLNISQSGLSHAIAALEQELGVTAVQKNVYMLDGCTITLQPLPPGVLPNIPRTLVTFSGEDDACQKYQQQFRLRFLSAGG